MTTTKENDMPTITDDEIDAQLRAHLKTPPGQARAPHVTAPYRVRVGAGAVMSINALAAPAPLEFRPGSGSVPVMTTDTSFRAIEHLDFECAPTCDCRFPGRVPCLTEATWRAELTCVGGPTRIRLYCGDHVRECQAGELRCSLCRPEFHMAVLLSVVRIGS